MPLKLPPRTEPRFLVAEIPKRSFRFEYERNESDFEARILAEFIYCESTTLGITEDTWENAKSLQELLWSVVPKTKTGSFSGSLDLVVFDGRPFDEDQTKHCWTWRGPLNQFGYATSQPKFSVHRAIFDAFDLYGEPLGDRQAHHRCRNKRCIKPFHIDPVSEDDHLAIHENEDWHDY